MEFTTREIISLVPVLEIGARLLDTSHDDVGAIGRENFLDVATK
jgi:hypothetical protein